MSDGIDVNVQEIDVPDKMNAFKKVANLIFSPSKLFGFIRKKPSILVPVILICIGAVVIQLLLWEQTRDMQLDILYNAYQEYGMASSPADLEQLVDVQMKAAVIFAPVKYLVIWIILTLILYLIFRIVGCEKGLKKYFSMVGYITLLSILGQLIQAVYQYFTGGSLTGPQVTSISSLIDPETVGTFLHAVFSGIEVFNIWAFVLYGIGFVYTGGVTKKKSYITTAVLFVIFLAANAGFTILTKQVTDNLFGSFM
jgi:hypothetical protein